MRNKINFDHVPVRRGALAAVAVAALATVGAAGCSSATDDAAQPQPAVKSPVASARQHSSTASAPAATVALVAYHGKQQQGFRIKYVPEGYVLQGVSGSTLDVAEKGDNSSLNSFESKLVVGLDNDTPDTGQPVMIGTHQGHYREDPSGIATLTYRAGGNTVVIQKWSNIKLTKTQLVHFAEGVTVTKDAQLSHG